MKRAKPISIQDIDALLPFIEAFERDGFEFAKCVTEPGVIFTVGNYEYSREARDFQKTLYEHNWIAPFPWPEWTSTAVEYVNDPSRIESADVEVVRKLLTTHVRQERFCEGHLLAMFQHGHLTALLRRLRQIRAENWQARSEVAHRIDRFTDDYDFLSNFHFSPIEVDGRVYPTVEHAFQAAKTFDQTQRQAIAEAATPGAAKRRGRRVQLRPDWEQVKVGIMEELVRLKFTTHADLREKLLATGDAELVEGNNWNDRFWGVCGGLGRNELGQILMRIREELG